jgi:DNA-binding transcriptional LysR family regulator
MQRYSLYASHRYLARCGAPKRGAGLAGYDLITFTGAPAATSPFFMGEALEGARLAVRCDSPLIQLQAAAQGVGIAELACLLGDECADLARIWPDEPAALRSRVAGCSSGSATLGPDTSCDVCHCRCLPPSERNTPPRTERMKGKMQYRHNCAVATRDIGNGRRPP